VVHSHRLFVNGVAIASLGALAAACTTYVNGNGVYHEQTRQVDPFVGIALDLGIQAEVQVGEKQSVTITGDANIVPDIETRVEGGILVTSTWLDGFDPSLPLRLYVTVPYLERAVAFGASTAIVSGAEVPVSFQVQADERSEIHLAGSGGPALSTSLRGGSRLEARTFPAAQATVTLGGDSAAELRVSGEVTGSVTGGSDLQIHGGGNCSQVTVSPDSTCTP
jgi:hypothetical protein